MTKLPRNLFAERAVLGSLLREPWRLDAVAKIVTVEAFHHYGHQKVFQAVTESLAVNLVTVAARLYRQGLIGDVGGYRYLTDLWDTGFAPCQATYWAGKVRDCWLRRKMFSEGRELMHKSLKPTGPAEEMLSEAARRLAG